jgi:hypothetical protein
MQKLCLLVGAASLAGLSCTDDQGLRAIPEPTAVSGDGATIWIPEGAIDDPSVIGISASPTPPSPLQDDLELIGEVYEFTPHGQTFPVPVSVLLPFDVTAAGSDYDQVGVYRYDDIDTADGLWDLVPGATFSGGYAWFETSTFSWYAVARTVGSLGTFEGSLELDSAADMQAFCAQYSSLTGDLTFGPTLVNADELDCLESIGGMLGTAGATSLGTLDLPSLVSVGGNLNLQSAPALTSISLASLERTGQVWLFDLPVVASVSMPSIQTFAQWTTEATSLTTMQGVSFPAAMPADAHFDSVALGGAFANTTSALDLLIVSSPMTDATDLSSLQSVRDLEPPAQQTRAPSGAARPSANESRARGSSVDEHSGAPPHPAASIVVARRGPAKKGAERSRTSPGYFVIPRPRGPGCGAPPPFAVAPPLASQDPCHHGPRRP